MDHLGSWDKILPLVEFTYNNSFRGSISIAPLEYLYGRKCRKPLCWYKGGVNIVGLEFLQQTTKKIKLIQERMKITHSREKSYVDKCVRPLRFETDHHVFLKVTLTTGVGQAIMLKKLTPKFIRLYQILRCIGLVAYEIALLPFIANLHNIFHVS